MRKLMVPLARQDLSNWINEYIQELREFDFNEPENNPVEVREQINFSISDLSDQDQRKFWDLVKVDAPYIINKALNDKPVSPKLGDSSAESEIVDLIGLIVICISIGGALIGLIFGSRVEVRLGSILDSDFTDKVWSPTLIAVYISAGLSGVLFGYLLRKVASVLRHLETLNPIHKSVSNENAPNATNQNFSISSLINGDVESQRSE